MSSHAHHPAYGSTLGIIYEASQAPARPLAIGLCELCGRHFLQPVGLRGRECSQCHAHQERVRLETQKDIERYRSHVAEQAHENRRRAQIVRRTRERFRREAERVLGGDAA